MTISPRREAEACLNTQAHRRGPSLAAGLADLTDEQWATTSLCTAFTVREVLTHLTAAAGPNLVRWLTGVIRPGRSSGV